MPKYRIRNIDALKIYIQGGINAVNGLSSISMVTSVMAVSGPIKVRRDQQNNSNSNTGQGKSDKLFAQILKDAVMESQSTPLSCQTITYGRDSRMQTFLHQSREYHY